MQGNIMREKFHMFCALGASLFRLKNLDIFISGNGK